MGKKFQRPCSARRHVTNEFTCALSRRIAQERKAKCDNNYGFGVGADGYNKASARERPGSACCFLIGLVYESKGIERMSLK
jgi:hypothetical protein